MFIVRREIIWESDIATKSELVKKEMEFIRLYKSNDPSMGYNQSPKFKK